MAKKIQRITSPIGTTSWSHIHKPNIRFDPPSFSLDLILPPEKAEPLIAQLTKIYEEEVPELVKEHNKQMHAEKKPKVAFVESFPWAPELIPSDDPEGDPIPTGNTVFKFKNKASYKNKKQEVVNVSIVVVDAKRQPVGDVMIGRGSTVKTVFDAVPYISPGTKKKGLTLRFQAVQLLVLKSGGNNAADAFGEEADFEGIASHQSSSSAPADENDAGNQDGGSQDGDF